MRATKVGVRTNVQSDIRCMVCGVKIATVYGKRKREPLCRDCAPTKWAKWLRS